jgi:acyl dehydratase
MPTEILAGPFFEDLEVGMTAGAPSLTLTDGHAAVHQSILGDRLRLPLDAELSRAVTGAERPLAHPGLVCDVAIGQSTLLTQRVIANLFYRGLAFKRCPTIGDTLHTSTEVVALRQTSGKQGRAATGLAALRIRTHDQERREVLDFHRCAMLPLRDPNGDTGRDDDMSAISPELDEDALAETVHDWRLDRFRETSGEREQPLQAGDAWRIAGGDVVSSAPELARLSLNIAAAHRDLDAGGNGRRLVYGGVTIGLAASQATLAVPEIATILAWRSCDHTAPVYEGDTLTSTLAIEQLTPLQGKHGGALAHLRSQVLARRQESHDMREQVLDWRFVALLA